ncbi:MAG: hypothetical protein WDO56_30590 [Gammaproteobacteria bacterium]
MKIPFSSFPAGSPSAGLLLLRFAVATVLLLEASGHTALIVIAAAIIAISLAVGSGTSALLVAAICQSLALALTGPGAYSLDARLFGRRLIFESRHRHGSD